MQQRFLIIILGILVCVILYLRFSEIPNSTSVHTVDLPQEKDIPIAGVTYFVSPEGKDENNGLSKEMPMKSLQKAIDRLLPGDGVMLLDGVYEQDFVTVRSGERERPIVMKGTPQAIVQGSGKQVKIAQVKHSHIVLEGFTIDGRVGDGTKESHYRDKLLYVESDQPKEGVTGLKVLGMTFKNAGGECIRIKYFAHHNEIAYNTLSGCGFYDFVFRGGGKNGEGIYIGTAPEQVMKDKNITRDIDASNENWIHHNSIDTQGNECVDIKEGSLGNIIEHNICTGQKDPDSAGLDSRGSENIFRYNEVFASVGAGIRLGGDEEDDGINNVVMKNVLYDNEKGGIKIQRKPQALICGNEMSNNGKKNMVGEYGSDIKNEKECPSE